MILVIASVHSIHGDIFVGSLLLLVVWLLYQAMWAGRSQRSLVDHSKAERARTIIVTPERDDPQVVGDVAHHQAQWPKAHPFASRANARVRGEG